MRSGRLDRLLRIERKVETVGPSGAIITDWQDIAIVRAELVSATSTEMGTGFGEAETGSMVFRIRWIAGLTNADRVVCEGRAYGLRVITEIGRRKALELRAVALQ